MKDKIVLISLICILCFCSCGKKQKAEDKELTVLKWVYEDDHVCKISAEQQEYFNKLLKDKGYAVSIDFIGIPTDDYIETVDKMVKGEDCPDVLFTGCGSGKDAVDGSARVLEYDWLDDLTEYLDSEEGEKLRSSVPEKVYKSCSINGRYYGLSSFLPLYSNFTFFINEDILEKNNIQIEDGFKYDIKEIKKLLEKVGKVENCTMLIPFDGSLSDNISGFEKLCNYKGDYCLLLGAEADSSEGIINLLENKRIQDYIITLTELRKNGYLEQGRDFFICVSNNDISTDVINSKIEQLTQKYGNKKIKVVQSDAYYMWTVRNGITGICKNSHNKEKSLEVLTAVMTDQNLSDALLYKTQDGKMDIKDKKIEPHLTYWYRALQFGNRFISTECVQEPDNKKEYMTDFYNSMPETALLGVYLDLSEYNETISKINALYTDYRELFEGKSENPEKEIEELNKKLYEAGIQELIDEANRQLKKN